MTEKWIVWPSAGDGTGPREAGPALSTSTPGEDANVRPQPLSSPSCNKSPQLNPNAVSRLLRRVGGANTMNVDQDARTMGFRGPILATTTGSIVSTHATTGAGLPHAHTVGSRFMDAFAADVRAACKNGLPLAGQIKTSRMRHRRNGDSGWSGHEEAIPDIHGIAVRLSESGVSLGHAVDAVLRDEYPHRYRTRLVRFGPYIGAVSRHHRGQRLHEHHD